MPNRCPRDGSPLVVSYVIRDVDDVEPFAHCARRGCTFEF